MAGNRLAKMRRSAAPIVLTCLVAAVLPLAASTSQALTPIPDWPDHYNPFEVLSYHLDVSGTDWNTVTLDDTQSIEVPARLWATGDEYGYAPDAPILTSVRRKSALVGDKPSLNVDIDKFFANNACTNTGGFTNPTCVDMWHGLQKLDLENGKGDVLREGFAWYLHQLAGENFDYVGGRMSFVKLYVHLDGGPPVFKGVYVNVEQRDEQFLKNHGLWEGGNDTWLYHYDNPNHAVYEAAPVDVHGDPIDSPTFQALAFTPFRKTGAPPPQAQFAALLQSRINMEGMLTFGAVAAFHTSPEDLFTKGKNFYHVDYSANFGTRKREYIEWDLDSTFGGGRRVDQNIYNQTNESSTYEDWIIGNPVFKQQFSTILQQLLDGPFRLETLDADLSDFEAILGDVLAADPNAIVGSTVAADFDALRDWLATRTANVRSQLGIPPQPPPTTTTTTTTTVPPTTTTTTTPDPGTTTTTEPTTTTTTTTTVPPPPPESLDEISVGDVTVVEGDSGTRPLVFPVTLSRASTSEVSVDYSVNWVTATGGTGSSPGVDFRASSGTLTFTPGAISGETPVQKLLSVPTYGDVSSEPDETFELTLSNPTGGYTLDRDTGTGTILNDDPGSGRRVSVGDASVVEGDAGTRVVKLPITVSTGGATVRVPYSISGGAAYGKTPASGEDFYVPVTGTLTFTGSEVSKAITVKVYGDTTPEADETLDVSVGTVLGATVSRPTGTLTIYNDDTMPGYTPGEPASLISVGDVAVVEGDAGTRPLLFPVTLSRASTSAVSVAYSVNGVTATGGTKPGAGVDFRVASGILTFTPGANSGETPIQKFVAVPTYSDLSFEPDETFELTLSNPTGGYSLGRDIGTGTILNESDAGSGLSVGDATIAEGDAGVRIVKLPVTLSAAPGATRVTMSYTITGGDAGYGKTPARNEDMCMTLNGTVTFTGNELSKTITVKVYGDTTLEPDETLLVTVNTVSGATASRPTGTIIIHNDE